MQRADIGVVLDVNRSAHLYRALTCVIVRSERIPNGIGVRRHIHAAKSVAKPWVMVLIALTLVHFCATQDLVLFARLRLSVNVHAVNRPSRSNVARQTHCFVVTHAASNFLVDFTNAKSRAMLVLAKHAHSPSSKFAFVARPLGSCRVLLII